MQGILRTLYVIIVLSQYKGIKTKKKQKNPLFPNVDGIYFLSHDGGCGGSNSDSVIPPSFNIESASAEALLLM